MPPFFDKIAAGKPVPIDEAPGGYYPIPAHVLKGEKGDHFTLVAPKKQ